MFAANVCQAGLNLVAFVLCFLYVPETKGRYVADFLVD